MHYQNIKKKSDLILYKPFWIFNTDIQISLGLSNFLYTILNLYTL